MRQENGTPAATPSSEGVAGALEQYLAAAEAGTAPPRDEFLARHPELADDLDACLAALRLIGRAAQGPLSAAGGGEVLSSVGPEGEPVSGVLGDFRIVREVGRRMGRTPNAVRKLWARALYELRAVIDEGL